MQRARLRQCQEPAWRRLADTASQEKVASSCAVEALSLHALSSVEYQRLVYNAVAPHHATMRVMGALSAVNPTLLHHFHYNVEPDNFVFVL